jgi:hypothetical protein
MDVVLVGARAGRSPCTHSRGLAPSNSPTTWVSENQTRRVTATTGGDGGSPEEGVRAAVIDGRDAATAAATASSMKRLWLLVPRPEMRVVIFM